MGIEEVVRRVKASTQGAWCHWLLRRRRQDGTGKGSLCQDEGHPWKVRRDDPNQGGSSHAVAFSSAPPSRRAFSSCSTVVRSSVGPTAQGTDVLGPSEARRMPSRFQCICVAAAREKKKKKKKKKKKYPAVIPLL